MSEPTVNDMLSCLAREGCDECQWFGVENDEINSHCKVRSRIIAAVRAMYEASPDIYIDDESTYVYAQGTDNRLHPGTPVNVAPPERESSPTVRPPEAGWSESLSSFVGYYQRQLNREMYRDSELHRHLIGTMAERDGL